MSEVQLNKEIDLEPAKEKKVMVMFSGGRDSILTVARLLADGYTVGIITFDNGCIRQIKYRDHGALILKDTYNKEGQDPVVIDYGIRDICGIWQMIMRPIQNKSFTEMSGSYKAMSLAQIHCATCKAAMVSAACLICQKEGYSTLASGDKIGDKFAIQHEGPTTLIKDVAKRMFGIEYINPIWDLHDTFEVKSELMLRGLPSKTIEPQCVISCPMEGDVISEAHLADDDCSNLLSSEIYPVIEQMKESWRNILR